MRGVRQAFTKRSLVRRRTTPICDGRLGSGERCGSAAERDRGWPVPGSICSVILEKRFAGRARSHRARAAPTGFTFRTCTALSSTTRARSTSPERAGIKKPGQMEWLTGFKSISTRITGAALRTVRFATRRNECYADCRAAPCGTVSQSVRGQGPLPQAGPELFASRARSHRQCPLPQARDCSHLSPAGCPPASRRA